MSYWNDVSLCGPCEEPPKLKSHKSTGLGNPWIHILIESESSERYILRPYEYHRGRIILPKCNTNFFWHWSFVIYLIFRGSSRYPNIRSSRCQSSWTDIRSSEWHKSHEQILVLHWATAVNDSIACHHFCIVHLGGNSVGVLWWPNCSLAAKWYYLGRVI